MDELQTPENYVFRMEKITQSSGCWKKTLIISCPISTKHYRYLIFYISLTKYLLSFQPYMAQEKLKTARGCVPFYLSNSSQEKKHQIILNLLLIFGT
jgi:hypothetical protein